MGTNTARIEPLDTTFGAHVDGVEIRHLDDDGFQPIYEAFVEFGLLVFSDQFLTQDEQNRFAGRFGSLEFEASPISNIDADGNVHHDPDDDLVKSLKGNEGWHHDSTYMPVQAKGAVFSAEIVPNSGAATGWADMRAAYDHLEPSTRDKISELSAYHSLYYSQGRSGFLPTKQPDGGYAMYGYHDKPVSLRPLVKVHPETGRANILAGRHAHDIPGMDPAESERFLDELNEFAVHPSRVYYHQWERGQTVVWDNRSLMHRGTPFDMTEPRRMWHTRIAGDPASETATNFM